MQEAELLALVNSMTLEEKAALCSGADSWTTKPNRARGIPALRMADGPHGLRVEDIQNAGANGGKSRRATCFPPQCAGAASFSPELMRRVGNAIAEECLAEGVGLLLGPGANIKRSPLCGRNFEYYSEDPLLSGELAAGFIEGVQEKGVGTSLKHFAVNNQETLRMSVDALVDERALFDIYLRAFEIAVRKAQPATVMASYNQVNGSYSCNSRRLLTDILRLRFGFKGAVISDWGAEFKRPDGIAAGLDLEMPGCAGVNDAEIVRAVQEGRLTEDALDAACWNLLRLIFGHAQQEAPPAACNYEAHHQLAVETLVKSAVLLKNDDALLPLAESDSIAVIGEMAAAPRFQGGGSSHINPRQLVGFTQALDAAGLPYTYTPGYHGTDTNDALLLNAVAAAKKAGKVLLFLGLPDLYECEGYDRAHLDLPQSQLRLLDAVADANPNICVVLHCGAPVAAPWLGKAKSLLCLYLGGEGVGEAALELLYGRSCPAGKLPESWPVALEDTPCYHHFPGGPVRAAYTESLYVGYRYYNTTGQPVLFPFGYGLSYTTFAYTDLVVEGGGSDNIRLSCTVRNTGACAGDEIVQVYASLPESAVFRPAAELVAFTRISLQPGQAKTVTLPVTRDALAIYDVRSGTRVVEAGRYTLAAGPHSRALSLAATVQVEGATLQPAPAASPDGPYGHPQGNAFPEADFATLYGRPPGRNTPPQPGEYTLATPIGQTTGSRWGRRLLKLACRVSEQHIHFSSDPKVNERAARQMASDLPLKNLPLQSGGRISWRCTAAILNLLNGTGSLAAVLRELAKRPPACPPE